MFAQPFSLFQVIAVVEDHCVGRFKIMARGRSWNQTEDVQLCRAWVHISHDPVVGTDQKADVFWKRVLENFELLMSTVSEEDVVPTTRTQCSIRNRFKTIQSEISKFVGYFSTVCIQKYDDGGHIDDTISGY